MPRQTNVYKLDRRDIEEKFILASVMGDTDTATTIEHFCELFVIPFDEDRVARRMADLSELKTAILEMHAKATKKGPTK